MTTPIESIRLHSTTSQQILSQFADDASFTLQGLERSIKGVVELLKLFHEVYGLEIN